MIREYISEHFGEKYRSLTLPGGFEIVHYEKPLSLQAAFLSVDYGSLHRAYRKESGEVVAHPMGTAHFLEHKLFESPAPDFTARMAKLGVSVNAYTTYERTCFYFFGGAHFGTALRELLELVAHPQFTEEGVEREKPIIAREIELYEDDLDALVYQKGLEALIPGHPAAEEILGTKESVASLSKAMLEQVLRDNYTPGRMQLLLIGHFSEDILERTQEMLPEFYTKLRPESSPQIPETPQRVTRKTVRTKKDITLPGFAYFQRFPLIQDNRERAAERLRREMALEALAGQGSPLYTEQYSLGNILTLHTQTVDLPGVSYLCISGEGRRPNTFLEALESALAQARRNPLEADALERIRRRKIGERLRSFDNYADLAFRYFELRSMGMNLFEEAELLFSLPKSPLCLPAGESVFSVVANAKK